MKIDYRELLVKYAINVAVAEGVDFMPSEPNSDFSQEEVDALFQARSEGDRRWNEEKRRYVMQAGSAVSE